jgi:hypothetical protein
LRRCKLLKTDYAIGHQQMRIDVRAAFIAILLIALSVAPADDVPAKLPADGWWVRYFVRMKSEQKNEEWTFKCIYSLVGTTTENDQRCRWVEMKSVPVIDGNEQPATVVKFLIPEKELLESAKPLESLVRAWQKDADGAVQALKFRQPVGAGGFAGSADFYFGSDLAMFSGLQQRCRTVAEKKIVEYQQGRLEAAAARAFEHSATRRALTNGDKQEFNSEFTLWDHPSVPAPGFAALRHRHEYRRNEMLVQTTVGDFEIEDFGMHAKSELPENH